MGPPTPGPLPQIHHKKEENMRKVMSWALVVAVSLGLAIPSLAAPKVPLVSKQQLKSWLKDPNLMNYAVLRLSPGDRGGKIP